MRVRIVTVVVFGTVAAAAVAARGGVSAAGPFVPCADIIGQAASPYQDGYRLVLGVMSVPPAYMEQGAVRVTGNGRWTYWRKTGMVVRAGNFTVTVSVPKAWRSRAAITWGNNDLPIVSSLKFTGCGNGPPTNEWNAWPAASTYGPRLPVYRSSSARGSARRRFASASTNAVDNEPAQASFPHTPAAETLRLDRPALAVGGDLTCSANGVPADRR